MEGYGYSLWLVPLNYEHIRQLYGTIHIPHVTMFTNLKSTEMSSMISHDEFILRNFSNVVSFPSMYTHDPLSGNGFYCDVYDKYNKLVELDHKAHMTLFYNTKLSTTQWSFTPPSENIVCKLHMADTRSINPAKWTLL